MAVNLLLLYEWIDNMCNELSILAIICKFYLYIFTLDYMKMMYLFFQSKEFSKKTWLVLKINAF